MNNKCVLCSSSDHNLYLQLPNFALIQCNNCNVLFKSSIFYTDFQKTTLAKYNSEEYWNNPQRSAETMEYSLNNKRVKIYLRSLEELSKLRPQKGLLLDVGCSKGVFLELARRDGWETAGIEVSSFASNYARENFGLNIYTGTLETAPWSAETFDVITLFDVIEHLADPFSMITQIRKFLKTDGILIIETPNANSVMHRIARLIYKSSLSRIKWPFYQIYGIGTGGHIFFFTLNTLTYLLKKNKFECLQVEFDPLGKALWRSMTKTEKLCSEFDNIIGSFYFGKYHMQIYAQLNLKSISN